MSREGAITLVSQRASVHAESTSRACAARASDEGERRGRAASGEGERRAARPKNESDGGARPAL